MKWIGQHIYDNISRFRDDVYLEDISTSTETNMLVVDSSGKISKRAMDALDIDVSDFMTNGVDNRVLTATGSDAMNAEANLTFDGSTLTLAGDMTATGDTFTFQSGNADDPQFIIKNTNSSDDEASRLQLRKDRGVAMVQNDRIGEIEFVGEDADQNFQFYGKMMVKADVVTGGQESGKMQFQVASHDGGLDTGLELVGGSVDTEIDATIGKGAASVTTIAGTLTMGSTATINNSGVIQVATQGTIDHDSLANFVAAEHYRWDTDISATATINAANIPTLNQDTTGQAGTVATIAGLAPNTATTQATQPNITTLAGLTSLGAAGATTDIAAGDLTMYNAVNGGDPTISLGSSATNRFEIKSVYNSSAQTLDSVDFTSYTTSGTSNDARYRWFVDEVELARMLDTGFFVFKDRLQVQGEGATLHAYDPTASSATEGGALRLSSDDGAAMADNHRLGIITFEGAEDASSNLTVGAQIESFCDAGWSASENGARMVFSTTDGNASTSTVLTLDSNKLATFTGPIACTTRTLAVTSSTDGDANGDVAYFGGTTSMTVGKIYHYKSDGTWEIANADAVATADGLLGVALGAASDTNGMLLRGMVTLDHDPGAIGDVLYVQSDNAGTPGNATATAPSVSGDCVRIIGYQVSHASNGNIWFNPDNTFVEVA